MKLVVALLALYSASTALEAQQLTKRAKIERILELSQLSGDNMMKQMTDQMRNTFAQAATRSASPEQKKAAQAQFDKITETMTSLQQRMRPLMGEAYSESFSGEEIDGMLEFYQSPAGTAVLKKLPAVMSNIAAAMIPEFQALMPIGPK